MNLMIRYCGYVCAHGADRIDDARPILNFQAGNGICVIACPRLRHVIQHAWIKAAAAAGAALEQEYAGIRS